MKQRVLNILIGLDQFLQTIVYLGKYNPDITISDIIGRKIRLGTANKLEKSICWFLRKIENQHCLKSFERDEKYEI